MSATKEKGSLAKAGKIPGATFVEPTDKGNPKKKATLKVAKAEAATEDKKDNPTKEPKAAKPKKEAKEKRMSQLDAAAKLLQGRTKPLTCQEMCDLMKERGLWESKAGKTPERTLSAAIDREIAGKGKESRFAKVAPGLYLLYGVKYTPAE